jgi:uncharacterized protein YhaN
MKIKDMHVDGFGVWTGLSVDGLPDGMTVFYGPNEAGKTTVMEFIRTVLYGFTHDRLQRYLPPLHGGTPGGTLRITGPGGGYLIRRRAQLNDEPSSGALSVTGADGIAQGQHRLAGLLGQVDESIFTNVFAIGLRELQELSTLDDTAAADELYKLSSGLDRVSLVDVLRQLQAARGHLAGSAAARNVDSAPLVRLLAQRSRLQDELENLSRQGRRWSELAALKQSQHDEITGLRQRLAATEKESRVVELAISVRDLWDRRARLSQQINDLEKKAQLPDDAPSELVKLEAQLAERREKLGQLRDQRKSLHDKAAELPVSPALLLLQNRIEAASEQAPWIELLQEQVQRLDQQLEQASRAVDEEAQRAGLGDDERLALLEQGRVSQLPDLSRATLQSLAGPARQVREHLFQLKLARNEEAAERKQAEKINAQLREAAESLNGSSVSEAIKRQGEVITTFRQRIQVQEHLEKLTRHRKELEEEAVDLATAEALPVDRTILLGVPFVVGGLGVLYGFLKISGVMVEEQDSTWGTFIFLLGMAFLSVWYLGRQLMDRGTSLDLEDCDRQLENVRKQIKEVERQRDEVERLLPPGSASLDVRLREAEEELHRLESLLPVFHTGQAANVRAQQARKRAQQSADQLKHARHQWQKTLRGLGLSESLSPASLRQMSDGYETLQTSLRRWQQIREEREQRSRELSGLQQRIDGLYRQVFQPAAKPESKPTTGKQVEESRGADSQAKKPGAARESRPDQPTARPVPREPNRDVSRMLQEMLDELTRQRHWIDRRKQLKIQNEQLKRQQIQLMRACERIEAARQSLFARCNVETRTDFDLLVAQRAELETLRKEHTDTDQKIHTAIGKHVGYDEVRQHLEHGRGEQLERRWEALTQQIQQNQERISHLQTRLGEVTQEMKQLAADQRLAEAQLELAAVETQLEGLVNEWRSLATVSHLLDDVCQNYEQQRQPETLREASTFLKQLTAGRYTRVWTPLGTGTLQVDNQQGNSLPLDRLSRGTREAVFIALRLALAAAFSRRGVNLPLVLDDVFVNFDRQRTLHAAETLRDFAALGHQVLMFTCHDHITEIFDRVGVQIRLLPAQGRPGEAKVWRPAIELAPEPAVILDELEEEPMEEVAPAVVTTELPEVKEQPVAVNVVEETPVVVETVAPSPPRERRRRVTAPQKPTTVERFWYEDLPSPWYDDRMPPELSSSRDSSSPDLWWDSDSDQPANLLSLPPR